MTTQQLLKNAIFILLNATQAQFHPHIFLLPPFLVHLPGGQVQLGTLVDGENWTQAHFYGAQVLLRAENNLEPASHHAV